LSPPTPRCSRSAARRHRRQAARSRREDDFDDNALYRHPDIRDLRDLSEDPLRSKRRGSRSTIHLDGNIGCMVSGAGLAMATMDIIKLSVEAGQLPRRRRRRHAEQIRNAFKILMSDPNVRRS
jgi:succinyl-CoA synthetase beta subunit